jgi:PAS domain S-box-containing protein
MIQPSILIVENEAVVAEDLAQKVTALGYRVIGTVSTGEAALEVARAQRPNLILLDIKLDGTLDGLETAHRLRHMSDLPFVFLTAHSDPETIKKANAADAFGYILKPFRERDLQVQLETALYRYRATKATGYLNLAQKAGSVGFFDYQFEQDHSVWTEGLAQLFDISLEEYEGTWKGWAKRLVPEDAVKVRRLIIASVHERREHVSCEFRAILPDRKLRWLAGRGQIFYSLAGQALRMTGVTIDITERKEAEQKLTKSEDLLLRAQRGAKAGVWEIDLRTDRITWSEPYYDLFGLPHSTEPSVAVWLSCIHPEDQERALNMYRRSIKEKHSQNMEFRIVKPDGEIRWIHRQGQVEVDERGHAIRMQGISFDVTERKHTDEVVKAIALFPAQNPSPVLRINRAGILLYMNPASTHLLRDLDLKSGQAVPLGLRKMVDNALHANQPQQTEYALGTRHYLITTSPALEERYANLYWTDITDRKCTEERLKQFTAELEQRVFERTRELVESERHLRTLATELNLAEQRERKRLVIDLHDHLQQLLVLGKLKLGQLKRESESLPTCANVIAEADRVLTEAISYTRTLVAELNPPVLREYGLSAGLKWLEEYMRKYQLEVTVQIPHDKIPVADDQAMLLFQSVRELLINSSKYAETSKAWVNANVDNEQLVIEVIDKGKGFVLASRGGTNISAERSSKFGLFSIRERMQALGGSFAITSSPGNGTTAVLRLPLIAADASIPVTG